MIVSPIVFSSFPSVLPKKYLIAIGPISAPTPLAPNIRPVPKSPVLYISYERTVNKESKPLAEILNVAFVIIKEKISFFDASYLRPYL